MQARLNFIASLQRGEHPPPIPSSEDLRKEIVEGIEERVQNVVEKVQVIREEITAADPLSPAERQEERLRERVVELTLSNQQRTNNWQQVSAELEQKKQNQTELTAILKDLEQQLRSKQAANSPIANTINQASGEMMEEYRRKNNK